MLNTAMFGTTELMPWEALEIHANSQSYTPYQDYVDIMVNDFKATEKEAMEYIAEWQNGRFN